MQSVAEMTTLVTLIFSGFRFRIFCFAKFRNDNNIRAKFLVG